MIAVTKTSLEGLQVLVTIEEDGTNNPLPDLPGGRVARTMKGTDGAIYIIVQLDHPVMSFRGSKGEKWMLNQLAVTNHFQDDNPVDEKLLEKGLVEPVRILKPLVPLRPDDSIFDVSKAEYFARGTIRKL